MKNIFTLPKKLFGDSLFSFKKEPSTLYDFARHGLFNKYNHVEYDNLYGVAMLDDTEAEKVIAATKKKESMPEISPKEIYQLNALNDNAFSINADEEYVKEVVKQIDSKLGLIEVPKKGSSEENLFFSAGASYGRDELFSIKERILNRNKITEVSEVLKKYPHTTSALISDVLKRHSNLSCKLATEFIPDMPTDAVDAMTEYNDMCIGICKKKSVFYIIAKKEDFEVKDRRRDPILLAQSPFGFFWQILGAWDEEMIYLGDL